MVIIPKWLWFWAAFLWTLIIFWGCATPGKDLPAVTLFDQADKLIHAAFFCLFTVLWGLYSGRRKGIWWWFFVAVIYGWGLEFYQLHFVPGRSFDVWDGVADSVGALAGVWMGLRFLHR